MTFRIHPYCQHSELHSPGDSPALNRSRRAGGRWGQAWAVFTEYGVTFYGACQQVLSEFTDDDVVVPVWIVDEQGDVRETTLSVLLTDDFGAWHLH